MLDISKKTLIDLIEMLIKSPRINTIEYEFEIKLRISYTSYIGLVTDARRILITLFIFLFG